MLPDRCERLRADKSPKMRGICCCRMQGLCDSTERGGDGWFFSRKDRKGRLIVLESWVPDKVFTAFLTDRLGCHQRRESEERHQQGGQREWSH